MKLLFTLNTKASKIIPFILPVLFMVFASNQVKAQTFTVTGGTSYNLLLTAEIQLICGANSSFFAVGKHGYINSPSAVTVTSSVPVNIMNIPTASLGSINTEFHTFDAVGVSETVYITGSSGCTPNPGFYVVNGNEIHNTGTTNTLHGSGIVTVTSSTLFTQVIITKNPSTPACIVADGIYITGSCISNAGPDKTINNILPTGTVTMAAVNTPGTWTALGTNPSSVTITNTTDPLTTISGFTTAGVYKFVWTVGTCNDTVAITNVNPLPVTLSSYNCILLENGTVNLNWNTISEQNNDRFDIQRNISGNEWQTLGSVKGHGTTLQPQTYVFQDTKPLPGINYYRLRQFDYNGAHEDSKLCPVLIGSTASADVTLKTYPNPIHQGVLTIELNTPIICSGVVIELVDKNGEVVYSETKNIKRGLTLTSIDLSSFSSGLFLLRVTHPDISIRPIKITKN